LAQAFAGVDRLLLISTDTVGIPGKRLNQHRAAVKAAEEAGVKHVVYTSLANVSADSPIFLAPDHWGTETALAESSLGWTILRNNIYAEQLIGSIQQALPSGQLFSAAAEGRVAYITREDCARAAAAALTSAFEGRRTLEITGPEALSQGDIATIATEVTGKQITYVPIDLQTLIQAMVGAGLPQPMAEAYASFDTGMAQGLLETVTNAFADLTGKHPTRIADFLAAQRDAFAPAAG
jgi:NAD(P)H dehydrogenase (quinone)